MNGTGPNKKMPKLLKTFIRILAIPFLFVMLLTFWFLMIYPPDWFRNVIFFFVLFGFPIAFILFVTAVITIKKKETNTDLKPKISWFALISLILSLCAAIFFFCVFSEPRIEFCGTLLLVCATLSFFIGFAALIQGMVRYHRLWWLTFVAMGICVPIAIFVIKGILAFLTM